MDDKNKNFLGRKLNAIWDEMRSLPLLFEKLFEKQEKVEKKIDESQQTFTKAVEGFAAIVAESNKGEKTVVGTVNIKDLYDEVKRALEDTSPEPFSLDYRELEKLFDKNTPKDTIKLENIKELAQELKSILPKDQKRFGDKPIETFGKALVKIEGNKPNNPVFVQLSDGKSAVDLKELFNVKVAVNGGGGSSDSGGGSADPTKYDTLIDKSGFPLVYVGEALPGALDSASSWRIMLIDKSDPAQPIIRYANGAASFINKWTDRATLDYTP